MREPTIERGYRGDYGDADARSRSAFVRQMREDSDRAKARALAAEARRANKRTHRLDTAIRLMQPLLTRLEHGLRKDAEVCGDNHRRLLAEHEIDELHREFNALAQRLAEDLR